MIHINGKPIILPPNHDGIVIPNWLGLTFLAVCMLIGIGIVCSISYLDRRKTNKWLKRKGMR